MITDESSMMTESNNGYDNLYLFSNAAERVMSSLNISVVLRARVVYQEEKPWYSDCVAQTI